jgi:hypothetical protein
MTLTTLPSTVTSLVLLVIQQWLKEAARAGLTAAQLLEQAEAQTIENEEKARDLLTRLTTGR